MNPKALLATIPSDAHCWNLIYLQLILEENGFQVHNLGPCTPMDKIEKACYSLRPDFIIISTVNGHGCIEGKKVLERVKNIPHMTKTPIYIGGKLSTSTNLSYMYAMELELAGFTKAFYENEPVTEFISRIKKKLAEIAKARI